MTVAEKIEMYREKKAFVDSVSKIFEAGNTNSSVESISYEVYIREYNYQDYFIEFIIVSFLNGEFCVKVVNGNSNTANFRAIGWMLDGGYYEEKSYYESMLDIGYEFVDLSNDSQ